jgi:hypothetical protein
VHAGRIGAYPVLARGIAGGWAVSDAAWVLESLDAGRLEPDWAAWAAALSFRAMVGRRTAALGTTRLEWGEALVLDRGSGRVQRVRRHQPIPCDPCVGPRQVVDAVLAAAQRVPPNPRVDLPLSAGWDSRALALALTQVQRPFRAWTIEKDDGRRLEVAGACEVARALDVPHEIIVGSLERVARDRTAALRRAG